MRIRIFLVVLVTFARIGCGQTSPGDASADSGENEAVHKAVDAIVAALDRNDVDAFARLSTPDYTFVNPAGRVFTKEEYLQRIRSGTLKVESYTRSEESIRLYGDTAVVIYKSSPKGTVNGHPLESDRRVTTVLVKQDGRWVATGRQSTPILEPSK